MQFSTLISADELAVLVGEPGLRLFDCRFYLNHPEKGHKTYLQGHLPHAQYVNLDEDLAGQVTALTGRHPLPNKKRFIQRLQDWGVGKDSQVVVYDDAGGAIAARFWWMCQWAGLEFVALLDGGINAWLETGASLTKQIPDFLPTHFQGDFDDSMHLSTKQVESGLATNSIKLTDARAPARYRGEVEPLDKVAGHVPGAINMPFNKNLLPNGCFLSVEKLIDFHHYNDENQLSMVSMCGSGITACHNILARKHAGLNMGKLYVGSWSEWITDSSRAVKMVKKIK